MALESVRRWRKSLNWQKSRATRSEGGYAPNLWPVWRAVTLGILTASLVGWLIYYFLSVSPASAKTAPIEVVRTTLTMMAGLAAVLTGIWAYRRQRLSEADGLRADDDQLTQRYSTAAEKLGHEKAAVRLAGVIAMARLADDWSKQRQQCIDVLCAYLRMPTEQDGDLSERQVRATIVRTIAAHLRKDLAISWARYDFDFTGAALHNADFTGAALHNADFTGAALHNADFNQARFSGKYTRFDGARFSGEYTGFDGATFSGEITRFNQATFSGKYASFNGATFSRALTRFNGATFSGEITRFNGATFSGMAISFNGATFKGATTSFKEATFKGATTSFKEVTFSGESTNFTRSTFSGGTQADAATVKASFLGSTVDWGPITPRTLPSPAPATA